MVNVLPLLGMEMMLKVEIWVIGRMRYEPAREVVEGVEEVLMTSRLVIGSAVKSVPSRVEDVGGAVCRRILAHV